MPSPVQTRCDALLNRAMPDIRQRVANMLHNQLDAEAWCLVVATADAFNNPLGIAGQSGGRFVLTGSDAVVVVNAEGQVLTTWATNAAGIRVVP